MSDQCNSLEQLRPAGQTIRKSNQRPGRRILDARCVSSDGVDFIDEIHQPDGLLYRDRAEFVLVRFHVSEIRISSEVSAKGEVLIGDVPPSCGGLLGRRTADVVIPRVDDVVIAHIAESLRVGRRDRQNELLPESQSISSRRRKRNGQLTAPSRPAGPEAEAAATQSDSFRAEQ